MELTIRSLGSTSPLTPQCILGIIIEAAAHQRHGVFRGRSSPLPNQTHHKIFLSVESNVSDRFTHLTEPLKTESLKTKKLTSRSLDINPRLIWPRIEIIIEAAAHQRHGVFRGRSSPLPNQTHHKIFLSVESNVSDRFTHPTEPLKTESLKTKKLTSRSLDINPRLTWQCTEFAIEAAAYQLHGVFRGRSSPRPNYTHRKEFF